MKTERRTLRKSLLSPHGLVLFEASARHLNFSKAAEELAITQSAVSHGVRQLEDALGQPLFLREGRALSLTSHGQRLYHVVAKNFGSIADALDDISEAADRDKIVISTSTVLATEWLLPRVPSLHALSPALKIEVQCRDRDTDLLANGIDIALRLGDGNWPGYDVTRLWPEQIVVVCSPDYLRRIGPISSPQDLLQHRLLLYVDPLRVRMGWGEWLRAMNVKVDGPLPVYFQANDSLLTIKAAEAGEGLALGWRPIIDRSLSAGRLVQALPNTLMTGHHHCILTGGTSRRQRTIKQVVDWLVQQVDP